MQKISKTTKTGIIFHIAIVCLLLGAVINFIVQANMDNFSNGPSPATLKSFMLLMGLMTAIIFIPKNNIVSLPSMSWIEVAPDECLFWYEYILYPFKWVRNFSLYLVKKLMEMAIFVSFLIMPGIATCFLLESTSIQVLIVINLGSICFLLFMRYFLYPYLQKKFIM